MMMRSTCLLIMLWCVVGGGSPAGATTETLSQVREKVRFQHEKAYAADPCLREMQSRLVEGERLAQAKDIAELRKQATQYLDEHRNDDELMSAYFGLRGACKQIAEQKNMMKLLKDAQLRKGWLELTRDGLAKANPAIQQNTSLAKVEEFITAEMRADSKKASARIEKLVAAHPFPKFVIQYIERWAEVESQVALAKRYIAARTPEELRTAQNQLDKMERERSALPVEPPSGPQRKDITTTAAAQLTTTSLRMMAPVALMTPNPLDLPPEAGPKVVILRELEETYEAVPFDHQSHAKMAQMWHGCETCHHRSPKPPKQAGVKPAGHKTQNDAAQVPKCKSCHAVSAAETNIRMPSLKAAYHRQCLNCHQEWMHENACVICHKPKDGAPHAKKAAPSPDDIMGRMHPPIPEPENKIYKTRYTPTAGGNVLFRHKEHTNTFGIKCVSCHYRENCSHCHNPVGDTSAKKPLKPGLTWNESHGPCMACHNQNHCQHCHFKDGQPPPKVFDHAETGQALDKDHEKLACVKCHASLNFTAQPTCGDAACHKSGKLDYPARRPGPPPAMPPVAPAIAQVKSGK